MVDYSGSEVSPDTLSQVLAGNLVDYVVSHDRSQYSGVGGASACGLAAMNCARLVLLKERQGTRGRELLNELVKEQTSDVSTLSTSAMTVTSY